MEIHTYLEMNQKIKDILRLGDDPMCLYAAARIEELETLLAAAVKDIKVSATRFDRIRACTTPADMAMELNKNERRFCPMEYSQKHPDCDTSCGECITNWLNGESET